MSRRFNARNYNAKYYMSRKPSSFQHHRPQNVQPQESPSQRQERERLEQIDRQKKANNYGVQQLPTYFLILNLFISHIFHFYIVRVIDFQYKLGTLTQNYGGRNAQTFNICLELTGDNYWHFRETVKAINYCGQDKTLGTTQDANYDVFTENEEAVAYKINVGATVSVLENWGGGGGRCAKRFDPNTHFY